MAEALPELRPLWDFNDPRASEEKFDKMRARYHDLADQAMLQTQIARAQGLQRRFEDAHQTLDLVEGYLRDLGARERGWYYIERGRAFNSSGEKDKARELFLKSFNEAEACRDSFLAVDAAHMMGIVESGDASLEWNEKAIAMAAASSDELTRNWLGSLYNNTAWTYHDMGNYTRALELFTDALAFREQQGQPKLIRIAKWSIARCLRSMGRVEEALAQQLALLGDGESDGYGLEEIGECLLALGRGEEARPYFAKAHDDLSKDEWLSANEPQRLSRLLELSRVS